MTQRLLSVDDVIIGNLFENNLKQRIAPVVETFACDLDTILRDVYSSPKDAGEVPQVVMKQHIISKTVETMVVNIVGHVIGRTMHAPLLRINAPDMLAALAQGIIDSCSNERQQLRIKLEVDTEVTGPQPAMMQMICDAYVRTTMTVLTDFVAHSDEMQKNASPNRPPPTLKIV